MGQGIESLHDCMHALIRRGPRTTKPKARAGDHGALVIVLVRLLLLFSEIKGETLMPQQTKMPPTN